jgi:hypothetical protein
MAVRVQYWLAMRNLDAVQSCTEQAAFYPETWNPNDKWAFLMLIRVYLAQHQDKQALVALERFCAHLDRPGDVATTVEFLALYMIGLYRVGKREQLHTVAARLLGLTKPETHLRVFLNEGEPMRQVLRSLLDATRDTYVTFFPEGRIGRGSDVRSAYALAHRATNAARAGGTAPACGRCVQPRHREPARYFACDGKETCE